MIRPRKQFRALIKSWNDDAVLPAMLNVNLALTLTLTLVALPSLASSHKKVSFFRL